MKTLTILTIMLALSLGLSAQDYKPQQEYLNLSQEMIDRDEAIRITASLKFKDKPDERFKNSLDGKPFEIKPLKKYSYQKPNTDVTLVYDGNFPNLNNIFITVPQHTTLVTYTGTRGFRMAYISIVR